MAISAVAEGTWAVVTADGAVTIPGSPAVGDRMVVLAVWKAFGTTAQITTPTGWTEITEFADGSVAAAANVGSVKVGAWYRDWATGATAPTLDYSAAPAPAAHVMVVFRKGDDETWDDPTFVTAAIASATNWTATSSSTITVPDGAVVIELAGFRDDSATMTRSSTTALEDDGSPNVTWNGNYVEYPATHASTTTSNDIAADAGYRLVTTGAAGVNLTGTGTLSASETGAALWIVQGATPVTTCYTDTVVADGPNAYWRLAEASGNIADEIVPLTGTVTGTPTYSEASALSGDSNTAITLVRASAQYFTVADHANLDVGDVFSIEFWLKRASTGTNQTVLDKGATGGTGYLIYWNTSNRVRLATSGAGTPIVESPVSTDTTNFHHYVFTKNGSTSKLYIDGVDASVAGTPATLANTTSSLVIGRESSGGTNYLDGTLDEVAIYNYDLTAIQVAEHYAARSIACAGPSTEADAEHASSTGAANAAAPSVAPVAGNASATGAANATAARVAPTAGTASATGAANAPAPSVGANAGHASATGAANAAGISTIDSVSAEVATATGAANQPSVAIAVTAGHASATGAANQPGISTTDTAPAEHASSTGAANQPSVAIAVTAGHASATGAAYDATVSTASNTNVSAEHASATGAANAPSVSLAPTAGNAAATGTANQPAASVGVRAEHASATGAAYDATVSTLTNVNASAGHAAATSAANAPGVSVSVNAGHASASGTANQPGARVGASAGGASVLAAAFPAAAWVQVGPAAATVTAEVYAALVAIAVYAGTAGGSATAYDATALGDTTVIGGFPPYATASTFTVRGQAVAAVPGGRSTRPTPGGNATNPKPGAD